MIKIFEIFCAGIYFMVKLMAVEKGAYSQLLLWVTISCPVQIYKTYIKIKHFRRTSLNKSNYMLR